MLTGSGRGRDPSIGGRGVFEDPASRRAMRESSLFRPRSLGAIFLASLRPLYLEFDMAKSGKYAALTPKNKQHTPTWRGGSATTPGGASYKGSSPAAHNPVKRGGARGR